MKNSSDNILKCWIIKILLNDVDWIQRSDKVYCFDWNLVFQSFCHHDVRNTQESLIVHWYSTSNDMKMKSASLLLLLLNKRCYWLTIDRFHCTVNIQQRIRQNVRLFEQSWKWKSNEMFFVVVYKLSFNKHALSLSHSFISRAKWKSEMQILWWVFFSQNRKASSNSKWRWSTSSIYVWSIT